VCIQTAMCVYNMSKEPWIPSANEPCIPSCCMMVCSPASLYNASYNVCIYYVKGAWNSIPKRAVYSMVLLHHNDLLSCIFIWCVRITCQSSLVLRRLRQCVYTNGNVCIQTAMCVYKRQCVYTMCQRSLEFHPQMSHVFNRAPLVHICGHTMCVCLDNMSRHVCQYITCQPSLIFDLKNFLCHIDR